MNIRVPAGAQSFYFHGKKYPVTNGTAKIPDEAAELSKPAEQAKSEAKKAKGKEDKE
jgi:hypothetical protein